MARVMVQHRKGGEERVFPAFYVHCHTDNPNGIRVVDAEGGFLELDVADVVGMALVSGDGSAAGNADGSSSDLSGASVVGSTAGASIHTEQPSVDLPPGTPTPESTALTEAGAPAADAEPTAPPSAI